MVVLPLVTTAHDESQGDDAGQVGQGSEAMVGESSAAPTELDSESDGEPAGVVGVGEMGLFGEEEDDRMMNGSAMPSGDFEEEYMRRPPPVRPLMFSVPDVLAAPQPIRFRSPGNLFAGDGLLAVAGMMHSIVTEGVSASGSSGVDGIEWCMPHGGDDAFNHCCRVINAITGVFYVGITETPRRRFLEHSELSPVGPDPIMVVLVEAETSATTAALEMQLLEKYRYMSRCANLSGGGEGASGGSPHFLYVLEGRSASGGIPPLIRRDRRHRGGLDDWRNLIRRNRR